MRDDKEFADVTLISEDKVKFSAHKIFLKSCSNVFKFILDGNSHANLNMFLSGVSSINLGFILDYIYYGEVNLFQEQLDSFLESAQKLEIEGLLSTENNQNDHELNTKDEFHEEDIQPSQSKDEQTVEDKIIERIQKNAPSQRQYRRFLSLQDDTKFDVGSMTAMEIDLKMRELYQKVDGVWRCLACDYSTTHSSGNMRIHVETHLEGLSYKCTLCSKEFRYRNSLMCHKSNFHK